MENKISIFDFVNNLPELKSGKVEILGAFIYWMEHKKKIVYATEKDFIKYLAQFKRT